MSGTNPDPNLSGDFAEAMRELIKAARALPNPISTRPLERLRRAAGDVVQIWEQAEENDGSD